MFIKYNINNIYYICLYNINDNDFEKYITYFTNIYILKKKCSIIFNLSYISLRDLSYATKQLKFMKDNIENTTTYVIKTAIVVPNKFIERLLNTFIFSVYEPIKPNIITNNLQDAIKFVS